MRRREFITLIGSAAAVWPLAAFRACVQLMRMRFIPVDGDHVDRPQREV